MKYILFISGHGLVGPRRNHLVPHCKLTDPYVSAGRTKTVPRPYNTLHVEQHFAKSKHKFGNWPNIMIPLVDIQAATQREHLKSSVAQLKTSQ